ncbi:arpin [Anaeramoeba ignava]|uniref:Arpin n=1 Tax=Anaeramoeba ignava TaxID=1746090 RepID=A0A9Q0LWV3_ANAIG|nr:arpin [Anaeramoeba ignava]
MTATISGWEKDKWPPEKNIYGNGFVITGEVKKLRKHFIRRKEKFTKYLKSKTTSDSQKAYEAITIEIKEIRIKDNNKSDKKGERASFIQLRKSIECFETIEEKNKLSQNEEDFYGWPTIAGDENIGVGDSILIDTDRDSRFIQSVVVLKRAKRDVDKSHFKPMEGSTKFMDLLMANEQSSDSDDNQKKKNDNDDDWD